MFFDILANFPGAGHAGRKGNQVPFADFYRFLSFWGDDNVAFQKIAGFGRII